MERTVAVVLISLLVAPPAWADPQQQKPVDWEKVKRLKAGATITLTVTGSPGAKVRVLYVDDSILLTLKPTGLKLAPTVENVLFAVGPSWPDILEGRRDAGGDVRVSHDGIFEGDRKVADLGEVIQQTPREDVLAIAEALHSHLVRSINIGVGIFLAVIAILFAIVAGMGT